MRIADLQPRGRGALGSVVTLVATVFIIPHLDTITGLLALTLPLVAAGAWIAAGSPRTNYIGLQFVFAFGLSQLGHFGPSIDLTEIRDRMIGILVGVAVSIAVSAAVWPEREGDALKNMLGRLLRSVADLVRAGHNSRDAAGRRDAVDKARLRGWSLLMQNREMQARVGARTWLAVCPRLGHPGNHHGAGAGAGNPDRSRLASSPDAARRPEPAAADGRFVPGVARACCHPAGTDGGTLRRAGVADAGAAVGRRFPGPASPCGRCARGIARTAGRHRASRAHAG
ncbi:hypothetical protein [Cupriavidus necator]